MTKTSKLNRLPSDARNYDANKPGITRPAKTRAFRTKTTVTLDPVTNTVTIRMPALEAVDLLTSQMYQARQNCSPKLAARYYHRVLGLLTKICVS